MNTARHSSPFAWWIVESVTRSRSPSSTVTSSPESSFISVTSSRNVSSDVVAVGEQRELLEIVEARAGVVEGGADVLPVAGGDHLADHLAGA